MITVRKIAELGHAKRKEYSLKVRQPLFSLTYSKEARLPKGLEALLLQELNIKNVVWKKGETLEVVIDTDIDSHPDLKEEGTVRDLIRQIQVKRKELGCTLTEKIIVILPEYPHRFEDLIKRETLADKLRNGEVLSIERA